MPQPGSGTYCTLNTVSYYFTYKPNTYCSQRTRASEGKLFKWREAGQDAKEVDESDSHSSDDSP